MTDEELNFLLGALESAGYDGDVVADAIAKIEKDADCKITDYDVVAAAIEITHLVDMWRWLEDGLNNEAKK